MSTKTNFKRVALVAVTTLGLGVLTSVAPANATVGALTVSATSVGVCASDTVAAGVTTIAMSKTGTLVITVAATPVLNDTVKTSGVLNLTNQGLNAGSISVDQKTFTYNVTATEGDLTFTPSGVGAATIYRQSLGTGANLQTVNITVLDSCAGAAVPNAANSYVQVIDTTLVIQKAAQLGTISTTALGAAGSTSLRVYGPLATAADLLDTSVDQATSFANGDVAYVHALARDAYTLPLAGSTYYYGIACTGDVSVNSGTTNGGFIAGEAGKYMPEFSVAQGTLNAGVTTSCSVTVNNTVIGTKSITFRGDLAKIEASLLKIGTSNVAAAVAGAGTISYKYFDAAGNRLTVGGTVAIAAPSLTTTGSALINNISSASAITDYVVLTTKDVTGRVSYGCVGADVSGDVSLVLKATNAAGATISANAVTASCGGALDTYSASLDKATYNTGDIATLTIKGLDANGKKVNDYLTAGAGSAIAVTGMTPVTAPATTDAFSGGELVYTYKVDNEAGNYVASVYLVADTQTAAVVQKVTITAQAGGIQLADVLKAIVSLIASINKQIAALQKALLKK
jgi:hypothetical protein